MSQTPEFPPSLGWWYRQLSDGELALHATAALAELNARDLPFPLDEAYPTSGLVNPFENPARMKPSVLADGRITIYHADGRERAKVDGQLVAFTNMDFGVLAVLGANADIVVPYDFLWSSVWSKPGGWKPGNYADHVKFAMNRLRRKLGELGHAKEGVIRSQRRVGYVALSSLKEENYL